MAIIKTYSAYQHRTHIYKFWAIMGKHKAFQEEYNRELFGKMLTGSDGIWQTLYFINKDLHAAHIRQVPERLALGDAYGIAKRYMHLNFPRQ
ncbi:hypothetical protein FVR03_01235 [Pontibacter qinzhouensis]|uniref:Uncharacterized protein n=2 Tax=Pontibacter qinzhouensis TaxID=2603253 RepID=A0A5C8KCN2_9BACT|nr:hypothetical protein FVR03_01235 [Pontibacter qinzhouensis]